MSLQRDSAKPNYNSREYLLPASFEERGAVVPFTTPVLAHARVRRGWRAQLELVIVGFSGGPGDYAMPWYAASDVVPMTAHDTLLYEEVMSKEALDPDAVRRVALDIAKTGLAGLEVAEAAARAQDEDDRTRAVNEAALAAGIVRILDAELGRGLADRIDTEEGRKQISQTLAGVADRLMLNGALVEERLRVLNLSSYAVGMTGSPVPGRIRRMLQRIDEFQAAMTAWNESRLDHSGEQAGLCQGQAARISRLAFAVLEEFDEAMADPRRALEQGEDAASRIRQLADRLAWCVDGWEPVVEGWFDAAGPAEQIDALNRLAPKMPWLPRREARLDPEADRSGKAAKGRRLTPAGLKWGIPEPEAELVDRIERVKAKAM